MRWHTFLVIYLTSALVAMMLARARFATKWGRLARALTATGALSFFVDYPAEHRALWQFQETYNLYLLDVPVENIAFMISSTIYILLIYLSVQHYFRGRTERARNQAS